MRDVGYGVRAARNGAGTGIAKRMRIRRKVKPKKTVTLNAQDAEHVYEWLRMYWKGSQTFGGCHSCERIGKRLEALIGPVAIVRVEKDCGIRPILSGDKNEN